MKAAKIPYEVIQEKAVYSKHANAWIFHLRDEVWSHKAVVDITNEIKKAEAKNSVIALS